MVWQINFKNRRQGGKTKNEAGNTEMAVGFTENDGGYEKCQTTRVKTEQITLSGKHDQNRHKISQRH